MKWWIHPIFFWTLTVGLAGSNILNIQEELVIDNGGEGFSRIQSVAIGPDERVFVLDSREFCVYVFDSEGKLLMRFGRKGQGPGDLTRPFGIASITGGDLVVTERLNRASIFRADGSCRRILKLAVNNTGFFGDIVFDTVIPRDVAVSEAPSHGQSVLDYAPRSRGCRAYLELCMEVLERD